MSAVIFFWHCEHHHLHFALRVLSQHTFLSVSRLHLSGQKYLLFCRTVHPSGQYYHLFGPSGDVIFCFAPWLRPSGDTIFYSTQRLCHPGKIFFYLVPRLRLSRQNSSSYNPSGLFAKRLFCELPWRPFLPDSSRLSFIGIGVASLEMPCNKQPFAFFLMLSLKASINWRWCCFSHDAGWRTAFMSFLALTHLDDGPRFGLRQSNYKFHWHLSLGGCLLSWYTWISRINLLNWLCQSLFRSEVSHSCHGPIPGQHFSFKYQYKSFKCAFNKFKDPIQDISRLTYFSVWQITSEAWPAQFSCFPMASTYLTYILWALSWFYSGVRLRCPPWESPLEHYLGCGMSPKSIAHTWLVLSLLCSNVSFWFATSVFVDSFALFCTQGFEYFCVERHRPNHASPWICSALLSTTATSLLYPGTSLPRSTVSLLLSSTLNQASATVQQATPSCPAGGTAIHLSRICERLFDWHGFINQVLGSMICGMD